MFLHILLKNTASVAVGLEQMSVSGNVDQDLAAAEGCFAHINGVFEELADYRAFELLRTQNLRSDYLLTKQVRLIRFGVRVPVHVF